MMKAWVLVFLKHKLTRSEEVDGPLRRAVTYLLSEENLKSTARFTLIRCNGLLIDWFTGWITTS